MKNFVTLKEVYDHVKKELSGHLEAQTETVLTDEKVAEMLGYDVKTVRNLISRKEIPYHRITGKKTVFLKSEIIRWIQQQ